MIKLRHIPNPQAAFNVFLYLDGAYCRSKLFAIVESATSGFPAVRYVKEFAFGDRFQNQGAVLEFRRTS